jgi:hypothetical protein
MVTPVFTGVISDVGVLEDVGDVGEVGLVPVVDPEPGASSHALSAVRVRTAAASVIVRWRMVCWRMVIMVVSVARRDPQHATER